MSKTISLDPDTMLTTNEYWNAPPTYTTGGASASLALTVEEMLTLMRECRERVAATDAKMRAAVRESIGDSVRNLFYLAAKLGMTADEMNALLDSPEPLPGWFWGRCQGVFGQPD